MRNLLLNDYVFIGLFKIFFNDFFYINDLKEKFVLEALEAYSKKLSIFQRKHTLLVDWEKLVSNISDFQEVDKTTTTLRI